MATTVASLHNCSAKMAPGRAKIPTDVRSVRRRRSHPGGENGLRSGASRNPDPEPGAGHVVPPDLETERHAPGFTSGFSADAELKSCFHTATPRHIDLHHRT